MLYYDTLRDTDPVVRDRIWDLICRCDDDFYPPLSTREPTDSVMVQTGVKESKPHTFFEMIQGTSVLVDSEDVNGVIAFYKGYVLDEVDDIPRTYVMFILVDPDARGRGLGRSLYEAMFEHMSGSEAPVVTRTWSTNYSHLALARSMGLTRSVVLENDRGNGVDTVFLIKD